MELSPGIRLGRYEITARLGHGGMGEVYRARDTRLDRTVALKILHTHGTIDPGRRARFEREARALAALSHPNIGAIYDIGEVDGQPYLVLEHIDGKTLGDRVGTPWRAAEIVEIGLQLTDALDAAHTRGIVHRDLKPSNIIFTPSGTVKLVDFGVAKLLEREHPAAVAGTAATLTDAGVAIGTVQYMAPEQVRGEDVDGRADLFALAVVLYELAAGQLPFRGTTAAMVWQAILSQPPAPLRSLNPGIPESLGRVILKGLEKDRERRYPSAVDMRVELARASPAPPASTSADEHASIVVLPFENLSPEPDTAYFSDGLTEEIIADLSKVRALRVISRTSAMLFRGAKKSIPEIARELNVQYVLEGSVRRARDSVRITAQLIDAAADNHLWAEKYAGTLEDVFDLQERLSRQIASALRLTLTPDESNRLSARPIVDIRAYDAWLRARHEEVTTAGIDRAIALIQDSLSAVGDNAMLYAALSYLHWLACDFGTKHNDRTLTELDSLAKKAMGLDPELPEALFVMALSYYKHGDQQRTVAYAKRAAQLDANSDATMLLGFILAEVGRIDSARVYADRALARDPLMFLPWVSRSVVDLFNGRFDLAAARLQEAVDRLGPQDPFGNWWLGHALAHAGRDGEACEVFDRMAGAGSTVFPNLAELSRRALRGDREGVRTVLDERPLLREMAATDELYPCALGSYLAYVGETAEALDWLDRAVSWGFTNHRFLEEHNRLLAPLRGDPRFRALIERARAAERAFEA
jgi:serine/threonine protein kinase